MGTLITRSGTRKRQIVSCLRYGIREAHCESEPEAAACTLLEASHGVVFQEQPADLHFWWLDQACCHRPDLLVGWSGVREFWEIKRNHEEDDPDIRFRTTRLRQLLAPFGVGYRLVPERLVNVDPLLYNASVLRRRADRPLPQRQVLLAIEAIRRLGVAPASELASVDCLSHDDLLALAYWGVLSVDPFLTIDADSRFSIGPRTTGETPWVLRIFA